MPRRRRSPSRSALREAVETERQNRGAGHARPRAAHAVCSPRSGAGTSRPTIPAATRCADTPAGAVRAPRRRGGARRPRAGHPARACSSIRSRASARRQALMRGAIAALERAVLRGPRPARRHARAPQQALAAFRAELASSAQRAVRPASGPIRAPSCATDELDAATRPRRAA